MKCSCCAMFMGNKIARETSLSTDTGRYYVGDKGPLFDALHVIASLSPADVLASPC